MAKRQVVWEVKMASTLGGSGFNKSYNVLAASLEDAVKKAMARERSFCKDLSESEGETFEPDTLVSARYICELN